MSGLHYWSDTKICWCRLKKKRHVWTCPMSVSVSVNFQKSGLPTFPTKSVLTIHYGKINFAILLFHFSTIWFASQKWSQYRWAAFQVNQRLKVRFLNCFLEMVWENWIAWGWCECWMESTPKICLQQGVASILYNCFQVYIHATIKQPKCWEELEENG